jgi:Protein of unknown function (DUF3551)
MRREDNDMKKLMIAGLAMSAPFAAAPEGHARVNYPWCIHGDTRGMECVFSTREQCANDGRNRGFGGQCVLNPWYNPNLPSVIPTESPKKPDQPRKPARARN